MSLYTLREAREDDWELLNYYCYSEGMDNMPSLENVVVAVNDEDLAVGFIRIAYGSNGIAHVNPVVVNRAWRGYAVGKTLVDDAQARCGELRLIARGASKGFYERLGFVPCGWDEIDMSVTENCEICTIIEECHPAPMKRA